MNHCFGGANILCSILVDFAYSMLLRGNGRYELDEPVVGTSYETVSSLFYLLDTLLLTNIVSLVNLSCEYLYFK